MSERNDDQPQGDDRDAYERALERKHEELPGDMEQDRNLSGSSTYETLDDQGDEDQLDDLG